MPSIINLTFTVLFTSWLFIAFRLFAAFNINNKQAIYFNYIICALLGYFVNWETINQLPFASNFYWIKMALLTGSCFLPIFILMSLTVERISLTASTLAGKISLLLPVGASLFFLNPEQTLSTYKIIGLTLGFIAIILTSIRTKDKQIDKKINKWDYLLPLWVFLGGGLIDILINVSNARYVPSNLSKLFPFFAFIMAASFAISMLTYAIITKKETINLKNIGGGILLGIPNYLSIFFLMETLKNFNNNGAIVFPVVNILIILFNAGIGIFFFKENLNRFNLIGLVLAIVALSLLINASN